MTGRNDRKEKKDKQDGKDGKMMRDSENETTDATNSATDETDRNDNAGVTEREQTTPSRPRHARKRQAERQAEQQAEYERHPLQWRDRYWEVEEQTQEATLTLPAEGYRAWLSYHRMEQTVGLQPSAYENPLSEYLGAVMGMQPRLQTDGQRAWFMLQLTKAMSGTARRYLRVVLPPWVTPLALEYTAFTVGRTSGHPQQQAVSAYEAYQLLKHALSDTPPTGAQQTQR